MATSDGGEFPYRRVVADLRFAIAEGRLTPGSKLGTEWELAERFGTSRPTIRRAIAVLKGEGLVVSRQGQGTFVRPEPPIRMTITAANYRRHREEGRPGFDAQVAEQGRHGAQRLLEVGEQAAGDEIAGRLGLPAGAPVVLRRRLFLVDDEPVARCDSWFDVELARGTALAEARLIPGGAHRVIEDPSGPIRRRLGHSSDEVSARMPWPDEIALLDLGAGVPVIRVVRVVSDDAGHAVEVQDTVAVADRHLLRYETAL